MTSRKHTKNGESLERPPLTSIMVSWFVKTVVIIHLTHVFAQYGTPSVLPPLLDATADELIAGLDAGDFTSLNLVEVRHLFLLLQATDFHRPT
jgi:hypothetical protein